MNIIKQFEINEEEIIDYLSNGPWYHSIRFSNELISNGVYDHEKYVEKYKFPVSLEYKTVLDVGCSDGFFSFEFEKRGAKEILAIDTNKFDGSVAISPSPNKKKSYEDKYVSLYKQPKFYDFAKKLGFDKIHNFLIAKKLLNSKVEYKNYSIYDIDTLNKTFDIVFCGDLIEHLKNPIEAVENLYKVTKEVCIISLSSVDTTPQKIPFINLIPRIKNRMVTYWGDSGGSFFHFSKGAFSKLILASGFSKVEIVSEFKLKNFKTGEMNSHVVYHCYK